jgi:hypothetical protein
MKEYVAYYGRSAFVLESLIREALGACVDWNPLAWIVGL